MKRILQLSIIVFLLAMAQPAFANHTNVTGLGGGDLCKWRDENGDGIVQPTEIEDCVQIEFNLGALNPNLDPGNPPAFCQHLPIRRLPIYPALADEYSSEVYVIVMTCSGSDGTAGNSGGEAQEHHDEHNHGGVSEDSPGHTNDHGASELEPGQSGNHGPETNTNLSDAQTEGISDSSSVQEDTSSNSGSPEQDPGNSGDNRPDDVPADAADDNGAENSHGHNH
jgi:hypothetical protein